MTRAMSSRELVGRQDVFLRSWPAHPPAGARILLIHGIAEHSGRYEATGARLAESGFDVRAFDLPGFGQSAGRRAYVDTWDDYLHAVSEQFAWRDERIPFVLLGHSMGALIALTYVLGAEAASRPMPDLLVLSGPPIGRPPLPATTRLGAPLLARLVPHLELSNGLHREQLSRDPTVGAAYAADPLVHPRTTTRLGHELFKAMARAERELAARDRMPVPTLVVHGADDRIASPANCRPLREIGNCEYRLIDGLRHEIFNEPEGPEVIDQVAQWIRSKIQTPAAEGGDGPTEAVAGAIPPATSGAIGEASTPATT